MRKDGVSEHCSHLCYFDLGCILQETLLKHAVLFPSLALFFNWYLVKPRAGVVLCSAQLSATELVGVQSLFYS